MVYLDNAATTRVCPEAAEAAVHMMTECFGNPSTTYKLGREAKAAVDKARGQIAKALGCQPDEVYFTSCGSEGDNWALISGARYMRRRGKHIISSAVEHDAVRKSLDFLEKEGYEITRLQPDGTGAIPLEAVRAALRPDTILVSLMMVNNETGAVNDIAAVARMLKAENSIALLHTDAVQGFLKVPFSAKTLGADMITISGHKIHAPKGIGALYIRSRLKLPPYILGGGQERGMRAGTEATPQIAAFGTAAEIGSAKMAQATKTMAELRAHAIDRLTAEVDGLVVIGGGFLREERFVQLILVVVVGVRVDRPLDDGAVVQGCGGLVFRNFLDFRIVGVETGLEFVVPAPDVQHAALSEGDASQRAHRERERQSLRQMFPHKK